MNNHDKELQAQETLKPKDTNNDLVTDSNVSQVIDRGQNLLLTQAFIPTSTEEMHVKDIVHTMQSESYVDNNTANLPIWPSTFHIASSHVHSSSLPVSGLKRDRSDADPFMGYTKESI